MRAILPALLEERLQQTGRKDLAAWTEAHPSFTESMRMIHALEVAKAVGAPLYFVHIACKEGVDIVSHARRQGLPVWGETSPHYLTHQADMEQEIGCWGKVIAPLRSAADSARLWQGIREGSITNLGTDHGTGGRTTAAKQKGGEKHNNIWEARVGIRGGLEHMLPVMMTFGVKADKLTIEDLVRVCSTNTAKVFGLYPRKGVLAPGADADIVIIDAEKEATIDDSFYHCLCEVSIYQGWKLRGMARTTLVRGRVMMEDFETVGAPGWGRYLRRDPAGAW